jgi:hypothetical protein
MYYQDFAQNKGISPMILVSRMVVQMLCLLSYLWASTCVANVSTCVTNVLQVHQLQLQEPRAEIILDEINDSLIIHHLGRSQSLKPMAIMSSSLRVYRQIYSYPVAKFH